MNEIEFDNFDVLLRKCKELAISKNKQYGVKNLLIFNGFGILTRMNDKIARLNNQLYNYNTPQEPIIDNLKETLNDTIMDLINYSIYLYLLKNHMLLKTESNNCLHGTFGGIKNCFKCNPKLKGEK